MPEDGFSLTLTSKDTWKIINRNAGASMRSLHDSLSLVASCINMNEPVLISTISNTLQNMLNHFEHDTGLSCSHYSCRNDTGRPCQHILREDRPRYINLTVSIHVVATPSRRRELLVQLPDGVQDGDPYVNDVVAGVIFVMTIRHGNCPQSVYQMTHFMEAKENSGYHYQPEYYLVCTTESGATDYAGRRHDVQTINPVPMRRPRLADLVMSVPRTYCPCLG